ncbi:hypothetical protein [uncultured Clostridium sp.]|uniref:hypothetical protein n=1 Tax=uncultured Clostridium sp. TaxID=59620 RepID=UPI0026F3BC84|nr:hypothetical protein [uncultured Clostridium sp.]
MLYLELKEYEQKILKDRLFKSLEGIVMEITLNYLPRIDITKQYIIYKNIFKNLNDTIKELSNHFEPVINNLEEKDIKHYNSLITPLTYSLADDAEYVDRVVCTGYYLLLEILDKMSNYNISITKDNINKIFGVLGRFYRNMLFYVEQMENTLDYKFEYLDRFSDDFIFLRYIAFTTDVIYEYDFNSFIGVLSCNKKSQNLLENTLEKYVAVSEYSDSVREVPQENVKIKKFFN